MTAADPVAAARVALALLDARGETLATAESLTGGLIGGTLTAIPGSSSVYVGGVVSYATRVKADVLGVPQQVIDDEGVVSRACALAMAHGVRRVLGADWGVATTGVAGPDAQDGIPAGTVWVAVSGPDGDLAERLELTGGRETVRRVTCLRALELVAEFQPSA
ncbi:CinA family protein [Nocardioides sp. Soil796]|uniref:CinA family protein n=1 Tax=Nocardioides sp. Soil796 TaxID=1736412 RepID=UPI00070C1297|nr:CinA family protein [Nocardioides sp. Soil796]KRF16179.1 hypothetical protein ASH02_06180 [Nocardioides sp. Soil796]